MRRRGRPITEFRRRLRQLIDARFDGKYTLLAKRAGIPISSMQHYVHLAKRLPGGEHLLRLAEACGVSVQYLASGEEVLPAGDLAHLTIPLVRCACPGVCPLAAAVPATAAPQIVVERALVAAHATGCLVAVPVTPEMPCPGWPTGARVVVDGDARQPRWERVTLVHAEGRCQLGHVAHTDRGLLFAGSRDRAPRLLADESRILGTVIIVMAPL